MTEQIKNQLFREDEVVVLRHWSKEKGEYVTNVFPKIGGRLRLAHDANDALNIETKIYQYNENIAVVIATIKTVTGQFTGIGMSSVDRDQRIAPAILELAETRAISRALRWAGFGIDACSAEEISHLENGNGSTPNTKHPKEAGPSRLLNGNGPVPGSNKGHIHVDFDPVEGLPNVYKPSYSVHDEHGDENPNGTGNGNGNGHKNRQLTRKQYDYIKSLGKQSGYDYTALTRMCLDIFGTKIEGLSTSDASHFIAHLQSGKPIPGKTPAPAQEHQLDS